MRIDEILEKDLVLSEKLRLKNTRGIWRYVFIFFAHSGDSWFWLIALLLIWFLGKPVWQCTGKFPDHWDGHAGDSGDPGEVQHQTTPPGG